ncbi:MAG: hypothetical protein HKN74_01245 [Acidimicrobiia bacterium]|nr:hypothetical protein [Acidimicrobiia bacterium]
MKAPPGNSLDVDQNNLVAPEGSSIIEGLSSLLDRIRQEIDYNDAKGQAPFRLGVHDGLRFAEDAIVDLLRRHGHAFESRPTELDA